MRTKCLYSVLSVLVFLGAARSVFAQASNTQGPVKITLDEAIQLALAHNHNLLAARTTIQQSEAEEITANLRPNPVLLGDAEFLPVFNWNNFNADFISNFMEFDAGVSYLFERGKKRQHRLQAAKDQTAVTRSTVADNERTLTFQVASEFVSVQLAESTLDLARQDLKSFQSTVDISRDRYKAGDISRDDFLKIELQLLQFQMDETQARLARTQGLSDLRQLVGYDSVPADYDVAGDLDYQPLHASLDDLQAKALGLRPDLRAAQQGVNAADSQYELQKAIGKVDFTGQINYTHLGYYSLVSLYWNMPLPIFNRNQGEIARTRFAITQAQEQERWTNDQVMTDVRDAYAGLESNDEVILLYRSGYLDQAQEDLEISRYAYQRGAAALLDFLDAERTYRATQLGYRQALASYETALEQLREVVGTRNLP
jgi:outer membrane protein, heavy metal efflux system